MKYLVYDVPGRADHPFEAGDVDSAKAWVESKLTAPKNARRTWVPCGGGLMLTVHNQQGIQLASLWLRQDPALVSVEAGEADTFAIAVVGFLATLCIVALFLIATNGWPT